MSDIIKIKRGLTINLEGNAEKIFVKANRAEAYAVKPTDFPGLEPKLTVKVDDVVKAGTCVFFDKANPNVKLCAPVSGKITAINRGERRRILEVVITPDEEIAYEKFLQADPSTLSREDIVKNIQDSGLWPCIIQRPYGRIANPANSPKAVYISAFDTAPLAPDYDFMLKGLDKEFQTGIDAIAKISNSTIHLNIEGTYPASSVFMNATGVQFNKFKGPHPAGNIGTQIHAIDPINKGDVIWTINPQDVISIGRLFLSGSYDASRYIALTGSEVKAPKYYKTIVGACINSVTAENTSENNIRYISGNVLTGTRIDSNGFLGYYDAQLTLIPEGDRYEFMGWIAPGFNKFSTSRTFFSWLTPSKKYRIDSNIKGGERALMITGSFEKVFPFDIYPMQLIKAIIIEDIDLMEKLGIYEVVAEDFALCEFVDTSKTNIQSIVQKGLDLMYKEMN